MATPGIPADRVKILRYACARAMPDPILIEEEKKGMVTWSSPAARCLEARRTGFGTASGNHRASQKGLGRISAVIDVESVFNLDPRLLFARKLL
jgi:hypothetical protein